MGVPPGQGPWRSVPAICLLLSRSLHTGRSRALEMVVLREGRKFLDPQVTTWQRAACQPGLPWSGVL